MPLKIIKTWVPSSDEWDDAWCNCPFSTYFHSREWAEIWADYSKGKISPDPLAIELSDGTEIILPFSKQKIKKYIYAWLVKKHISSPAGTFGGWLSNASLDQRKQALLINFIAKRYPDLTWRFNPYEKVLFPIENFCLTEDETHTLDLSVGFEDIYNRWTKGHASAARKARRAGIEISVAKTIDDWKSYFRTYEDSLSRWGEKASSIYSWYLFETIFLRNSSHIKLWLARHDEFVIAGALCFYSSTHVVYWHGAAVSDYFYMRPVNLLMHDIIKDACNNNYLWFDFNPSGEHDGVKSFKNSFGCELRSCSIYVSESRLVKATNNASKLIKAVKYQLTS
ncbi:MAG: GNAT family N-acetyltransferase [Chlorobium sp.]|uniref:GNAT family N-acetyltransferase n=1 Tax=Chlorobium sp. TaxID=1095 RepID=UPI002F41B5C6